MRLFRRAGFISCATLKARSAWRRCLAIFRVRPPVSTMCTLLLAVIITACVTPASGDATAEAFPSPMYADYYDDYNFAGAFDYLNEQDVVQTNRGISVPLGGQYALDPEADLSLWVPPGDRCRVRVIRSHLSQLPGLLEPDEFPCLFSPGDVVYTHYGGHQPEPERVTLLVRYDSAEDTAIVPLSLEVRVDAAPQLAVQVNMPLTVPQPGGLSPALGPQHLTLKQGEGQTCEVMIVEHIGLPRYGKIVAQQGEKRGWPCDDLAAAGIQYRHGTPQAPDQDFIAMAVELQNSQGTVTLREHFQVAVHIEGGLKNTPPKIVADAPLILDVRQLSPTPLRPQTLSAIDSETSSEELFFNVTSPLGYGEGKLFSSDNPESPLWLFSHRELKNLKISYQPPSPRSSRQRVFRLEICAIDAEGLASPPATLSIVVHPINTMSPVVTRNTGLSLFEGQSRRLLSAANLEITDQDNLSDVVVDVVDGLRHGKLLLFGSEVRRFSPADLDTGLIVYQHDGSDTTSDNVLLRAFDGVSEVLFVLPITIFPEDDQPPVVTVNTGVTVHRSQEVRMTERLLAAADIDSPSRKLIFQLRAPSEEGIFVLKRPKRTEGAEWRLVDGLYERSVTIWSQGELLDGHLYFRHIGRRRSNLHREDIEFTVQDSATPPNKSPPHVFSIAVLPVDDQPPALKPGASLSLVVEEGLLKPLDRASLQYVDDTSTPEQVIFVITGPPVEVDQALPPLSGEPGNLVLTERPDQKVSNFTQAQVNHHRIAFRPGGSELGQFPRVLQLDFSVQDEAGNMLRDQFLTVFLTPVDDRPPRVTSRGLRVKENGAGVITPNLLDAEDPDTAADDLKFILTEPPSHGVLSIDGRNLTEGEHFWRDSLSAGRVVYIHSGSESNEDHMLLEVTDGSQAIPVAFPIDITPVDDQPPRLLTSSDSGKLYMSVNESGTVILNGSLFSASDPDSPPDQLTFFVTTRPTEGSIGVDGKPTSRFTMKELESGTVTYRHTGGEIGPGPRDDRFGLMLSDMSDGETGNHGDNITIIVTISAVDDRRPVVSVSAGGLYVDEAAWAELNSDILSVSDVDTLSDQIECVLVSRPQVGYLEITAPARGSEMTRHGAVTSFSAVDLHADAIRYVQSVHQSLEPRNDSFSVTCSDGAGDSAPATVQVLIRPVNDEVPRPITRELVVLEGGDLAISSDLLTATDADLPPDVLTFHVTSPPRHGQLILRGEPARSFTADDLRGKMALVYSHDDSETHEDGFKITLVDGHAEHSVEANVSIKVVPVDDEVPTLAINRGLQVLNGGSALLTSSHLRASDADTPPQQLSFVLRTPPGHGRLTLTGNSSSTHDKDLDSGDSFTQPDLNSGRLLYTHSPGDDVAGNDIFRFDVTDGSNWLMDRRLMISIASGDTAYPRAFASGLQLPEGGTAVLTTDNISSSDADSDDADLVYRLTRLPTHGQLELASDPGEATSTFTQLQLAGGQVRYVHRVGDEERADSFEFAVSDGVHATTRTFRISLLPVDNKRPVLFKESMQIQEGDERVITPFELKVDDVDTSPERLLFKVVEPPRFGQLLYNHTRVTRQFTQHDIDSSMISYHHNGVETASSDSFSLVVTDGADSMYYIYPDTIHGTRQPTEVLINVDPVDNRAPELRNPRPVTSLGEVAGTGRTGVVLGPGVLSFSDEDSEEDSLVVEVTAGPEVGRLVDLVTNSSVSNFTQGKLRRHEIAYLLNEDANSTTSRDSFVYTARDPAGNQAPELVFSLTWCWVTLGASQYQVNETEPHLEVQLNRSGYLGGTSFVSISVENGTAALGGDVSGSFANQVQFSPGQSSALWRLRLQDDTEFEREETLQLRLHSPVEALVSQQARAQVVIQDPEDESVAFLPRTEYRIEENVGVLHVRVERAGDLRQQLTLLCTTRNGTAAGTSADTVLSRADFISRLASRSTSRVTFKPGDASATCSIRIVDDVLYEPDEEFEVELSDVRGGRLGREKNRKAQIVIISDAEDAPYFYFAQPSLDVVEASSTVEITVMRAGSDLGGFSAVSVTSRPGESPQATAGSDYLGVGVTLTFGPGQSSAALNLTVLDDLGVPRLEGPEELQLVLRLPQNGTLMGQHHLMRVTIDDSVSDLPTHEFSSSSYEGYEEDDQTTAYVLRRGDVTMTSSLRCYTRQGSATAGDDFDERPDTDVSRIVFKPGELEKPCPLVLINDHKHEPEERLRLVLGSPLVLGDPPGLPAAGPWPARLGLRNTTEVTIKDTADKPLIKLESLRLRVTEPVSEDDPVAVRVAVVRLGDLSQPATTRLYTRDGSARAGADYHGVSRELTFAPNVTRLVVPVDILQDELREHREAFTVHLAEEPHGSAEVSDQRAVVYIEEVEIAADVTFPVPPIVVSLQDYDDVTGDDVTLLAGYPVVCVTACDPAHPDRARLQPLCSQEGIDNNASSYRWLVASASPPDRPPRRLRQISTQVFFASTTERTLDAVYLPAGGRVQCAARAADSAGRPGAELLSQVAALDTSRGLCEPRSSGVLGAEPFTAKLQYTGTDDPENQHQVRVTVLIPHRDGLLPALSTRPLSNFDLTLSSPGARIGNHRCSNLLDVHEVRTRHGFVTNATRDLAGAEERRVAAHQWDSSLRSPATLRFYRSLDWQGCVWRFEALYDISELVSKCGAQIETEREGADRLVQSYVSLSVPLYVSYVFLAPDAPDSWQHSDMRTQLRLTFAYDTSVLWSEGISPPEQSRVGGHLYPTGMRLRSDGRLAVNFRTEAGFRGLFLPEHALLSGVRSRVTSRAHPEMQFTLSLAHTEPTFEQPSQQWQFVSDHAAGDYSGNFSVQLIPCLAEKAAVYSEPPQCNPAPPTEFDLVVRFQQVSDPVPAEFSLNTQFHVLKKREAWLSETFDERDDVSFTPGERVLGRIQVDPVQYLGGSFHLSIDKCFLCVGADGYVPKFSPGSDEYGCAVHSPNLLHRFKILDRDVPSSSIGTFKSVPFHSRFLRDDPVAYGLQNSTNLDGFSFESTPLFQLAHGRRWFIHCTYEIRSAHDRGRQKRHILTSVGQHESSVSDNSHRRRRSVPLDGIGQEGRGTNMHVLSLDYRTVAEDSSTGPDSGHVLLVLGGLLLGAISSLLLGLLTRRRCNRRGKRSSRRGDKRTSNFINDREMTPLTGYTTLKLPIPSDYPSDYVSDYTPISPTTSCATISAHSQLSTSSALPPAWGSVSGHRWGGTMERRDALRPGRVIVRAGADGGAPVVMREYVYDEEPSEA